MDSHSEISPASLVRKAIGSRDPFLTSQTHITLYTQNLYVVRERGEGTYDIAENDDVEEGGRAFG